MNKTVISVENLSKSYRLGQINTGTFTNDLAVMWSKMRGKPNPFKAERIDHGNREGGVLWALRDVNFTVQQGEVLGIIGRNGAGKSTLLKILSRVTAPTSGRVKVKGRIASLLEVGTGFHPELTGRENIFLNGAILGMSQREIVRKFDEIVDFADVEKFIDTPVKRYSSGMYVRLAFAVAAHLEPEILVVDEVLAVGDAEFQKKCLGKMGDVAKGGRTVLFVSHNMQAVRQLCKKTIWIDKGQIKAYEMTHHLVDDYIRSSSIITSVDNIQDIIRDLPPDPVFQLNAVSLMQNSQPISKVVFNGDPLLIEIKYNVLQKTTGLRIYFDLLDNDFSLIFRSFHDNNADGIPITEISKYESCVSIPANLLAPRDYFIKINAGIFNVRYLLPLDGIFIPVSVVQSGNYNKAYASDTIRGKLAPVLPWKTIREFS